MSWLTCQCRLTALHGPMLERRLSRGPAGYDESSFVALLQGGQRDGAGTRRHAGPSRGRSVRSDVRRDDHAARVVLGTPYAFDPPDGCVLFLEDVNERPYRIDRMLTQLAQSGTLSKAAALVFGEMRGCVESGDAVTARDVIQRLTREFRGPVLFGFPVRPYRRALLDTSARRAGARDDAATPVDRRRGVACCLKGFI